MEHPSKGSSVVIALKQKQLDLPLTAAERARARVMRIYAARLKRIADVGSPKRVELLRTLVFLDSARGRELCELVLEGERAFTPVLTDNEGEGDGRGGVVLGVGVDVGGGGSGGRGPDRVSGDGD
jgi:hypothetical protein